jgi:hypothetical protein
MSRSALRSVIAIALLVAGARALANTKAPVDAKAIADESGELERKRLVVTGASVMPPAEPGWVFLGQGPGGLAIVRKGAHESQTWSVSVKVSLQPKPVESRADLEGAWKMTSKNTDSVRYRLLESTIEGAPRAGVCVQRRSKIEDRGSVRAAPLSILYLDSMDLICAHPESKYMVVELNVSERDRKGAAVPGRVEGLAKQFFGSLRFEKIR